MVSWSRNSSLNTISFPTMGAVMVTPSPSYYDEEMVESSRDRRAALILMELFFSTGPWFWLYQSHKLGVCWCIFKCYINISVSKHLKTFHIKELNLQLPMKIDIILYHQTHILIGHVNCQPIKYGPGITGWSSWSQESGWPPLNQTLSWHLHLPTSLYHFPCLACRGIFIPAMPRRK